MEQQLSLDYLPLNTIVIVKYGWEPDKQQLCVEIGLVACNLKKMKGVISSLVTT